MATDVLAKAVAQGEALPPEVFYQVVMEPATGAGDDDNGRS